MICIIFKLKGDLPTPAQDRVLEDINQWHHQNRAGRLQIEAADKEERSLCYVYVADDTTAKRTLSRLHETNEVEYAHVPSSRYAAEMRH